jgi:hypothetical protein
MDDRHLRRDGRFPAVSVVRVLRAVAAALIVLKVSADFRALRTLLVK